MATLSAKAEDIDRKWYVIDAKDQILGHVAERAARILRGKDKPAFTPHIDNGDFVIVLNAGQVQVTGRKTDQKVYRSYSGYPGGHHEENFRKRRERHPEMIIESAVRGMLPHNRLGRAIYKKLKVYAGEEHPHSAQEPQQITL